LKIEKKLKWGGKEKLTGETLNDFLVGGEVQSYDTVTVSDLCRLCVT